MNRMIKLLQYADDTLRIVQDEKLFFTGYRKFWTYFRVDTKYD